MFCGPPRRARLRTRHHCRPSRGSPRRHGPRARSTPDRARPWAERQDRTPPARVLCWLLARAPHVEASSATRKASSAARHGAAPRRRSWLPDRPRRPVASRMCAGDARTTRAQLRAPARPTPGVHARTVTRPASKVTKGSAESPAPPPPATTDPTDKLQTFSTSRENLHLSPLVSPRKSVRTCGTTTEERERRKRSETPGCGPSSWPASRSPCLRRQRMCRPSR